MHAFNPRQVDLCEFTASLVYKESSRTAMAVTQRNPVLKNNKQTNSDNERQRRTERKKIKLVDALGVSPSVDTHTLPALFPVRC